MELYVNLLKEHLDNAFTVGGNYKKSVMQLWQVICDNNEETNIEIINLLEKHTENANAVDGNYKEFISNLREIVLQK